MATVYSGPGFVTINAVPVLQSSSIDFDVDTQNKDVQTLLLGTAGFSVGPQKVMVRVDNAIPQSGMEFNWVALALAQQVVTLGFRLAGTTYTCTGDIRTVKAGTKVADANTVSWEFHGKITSGP